METIGVVTDGTDTDGGWSTLGIDGTRGNGTAAVGVGETVGAGAGLDPVTLEPEEAAAESRASEPIAVDACDS